MRSRPCVKRGCTGIIRDDVCSRCGEVKTHGWSEDRLRGSRIERGYDQAWVKLRAEFIARKTLEVAMDGISAYPLCEMCGKPIVEKRDIHVDHIIPFDGLGDPLRLDPENLRLLHAVCHMQHHAKGKQCRLKTA